MFGFGVASELWKDNRLRGLMGDLVTKTLKADVHLLQNGTELYYRLLRSGLQSGLSLGRGGKTGTAEAAAVIKEMIQLNVDYYSTLVDLNLEFADRLLDTMRESTPAPDTTSPSQPAPIASPPTDAGSTPTPPSTAPVIPTMLLVACVGDRLRAPFRIENNRAEPTPVSFHLSPFEREDGGQIVASAASFDPPVTELQIHQESRIYLVLPVSPEFEPGHRYTASLSVEGMDTMQLRVCLEVRD